MSLPKISSKPLHFHENESMSSGRFMPHACFMMNIDSDQWQSKDFFLYKIVDTSIAAFSYKFMVSK